MLGADGSQRKKTVRFAPAPDKVYALPEEGNSKEERQLRTFSKEVCARIRKERDDLFWSLFD